jgi:hypothetical protein
MTQEQNDALRKRALLMAGLQIMAASGRGESTGQALLAGVQGGSATAAQLSEQERLRRNQAQVQELVANGQLGPDQLMAIYQQALNDAAGLLESILDVDNF